LFACYAIYRTTYPEVFVAGSHRLDFWIGTLNTAILLTSSLCLALADNAVKLNHKERLRWYLAVTWLLGALFLGLKFYEYHEKFVEHLVPGANFLPGSETAPQLQLFFFLYFAMTGLHALHMIVGLGLIAWLWRRAGRGTLSPGNAAPVEMTGIYWHFVDCIWVFLYPLLYLVR
jgi:cytochrome c oxidase subunit 3